MVVVVEYVLIDNMVINSLLLFLTGRALKLKLKWRWIYLAAGFGTVFALVSPIVSVTGLLAIFLKLFIGLIMCVFMEFSLSKLLSKYLMFLLLTFMFGGALIAIFTFLGTPVESALTLNYSAQVPLGAILLGVSGIAYAANLIIKNLYKRKNEAQFLYNVSVTLRDKEASFTAFMDSGNRLYDPQTKAPVAVISADLLINWFNEEECLNLIMGKFDGLQLDNAHVLNVESAGGGGKMLIFRAQEFKLLGKAAAGKVYLGVSFKRFKNVFNTKMLLNPDIII